MEKIIKVGQVWQDCWGRKWQAVEYHTLTDKWSMRMWSCNYCHWFGTQHIINEFNLIHP